MTKLKGRKKTKHPLPVYHPVRLICTWFGSGLSPVASGTAGSLAALPFAYVIQFYFGGLGLLIAALVIFYIGWWASNVYLRTANNPEDVDPKEIVVDEVAGQWLLLSALPATPQAYIISFLLFRLFDVVKPWPVSVPDRKMHNGLGIMLDDWLAAAYPVVMLLIVYTLCYITGQQHIIFSLVSWLNNGG